MSETLFKNKKEFDDFVIQHSILDSSNNQYCSKEEFVKFWEESYALMLKKDNSFLYSDQKLAGKIALRKLFIKMDAGKL